MSQRTVITGGMIISGSDEIRADLVIDDHQIVAMLDDATGVDTDEQIDASDLLILPGGVDLQGPTPRAGAGANSTADQRAASAGGITTLVADLDTALDEDGVRASQTADFAYWYPLTGEKLPTAEQLSRMAQTGITGFSASMRQTTSHHRALADTELLSLLTMLSRLNVPLSLSPLHAGISVTNPLCELAAVSTALLFAENTGAWLHLRNITTAAAMHQIVESRARGARITASVSALHLALTASDATRLIQPLPPLRSKETIDDLWPFVLDESADCIGSLEIRRKGREGAPVSDIQTILPIFWDEAVNRRKMSRQQAVRMLATNPAQIAGLHPRKGAIRVGSDADLVLFDPFGSWMVQSREMRTEARWSPLDDRDVTGFVVRTIRRGVTVYDADRHDDDTMMPEGSGALLARV